MTIAIGKFRLVGSEPDITKSEPELEWEAGDLWITYSRYTPPLSDRLENKPPVSILYPHVLYAIDRSQGKHGQPFLIITHEYFEGRQDLYVGLFDGTGEHTNLGEADPDTSTKVFLRQAFHYLGEHADISSLKRINVNPTKTSSWHEKTETAKQRKSSIQPLANPELQSRNEAMPVEREYESLLLNIKDKKLERVKLLFDFRDYSAILAGIVGFGLLVFLEGQVNDHNREIHGYDESDHSKFIFMYLPSIIIGFLAGYATSFIEHVKPNLIACTQELDRLKARLKSIETFHR